ncbi:family 2 glycosyl transferase [Paenibacillus sp. FSL R7-277]|uniref:glycosyltransferase family 2 protein n=1 Tax=unclassified Paenibacillus TaxID=185978 RepID=UPI0003E1CDE9|nr:glycosyltransferase [Paenibacillus sp. FSL R7-277]ETT65452.1 family 2 glycosyl transferase [Paenibacillus sp. FSL R7-277]
MRFSFIIPAYQNKDLLLNCLKALNYQEGYVRDEYEVIVIDDGSNYPLYPFIENINQNYDLDYLYLDRDELSSRSRARNHGLKVARGEYIIFIDADIIVKPDYLAELDRVYRMEAEAMVVGTRLMLRDNVTYQDICNKSVFDKFSLTADKPEMFDFRLPIFDELSYNSSAMKFPYIYGLTCNLAVPKSKIELAGGFDEELIFWGIEDIELSYRLYKAGVKVIINSKLEVLHQLHGNHGNFVEEDKIEGLYKNIDVFLRKHRGVLPLSDEEVYAFFSSIATRYNMLEARKNNPLKLKFEFSEKQDLEMLKETIEKISDWEGHELEIYDFIEDTDLDIWIQLLGKRKSSIRYYPMTMKFIFEKREAVYEKI